MRIRPLVSLNRKEAQLETLQVVWKGATLHYKKNMVEDERINKKLKLMVRTSGRSAHSFFAREEYGNTMNNQGNASGQNTAKDVRYFHHGSANQYMYSNSPNLYQHIPSSRSGHQK